MYRVTLTFMVKYLCVDAKSQDSSGSTSWTASVPRWLSIFCLQLSLSPFSISVPLLNVTQWAREDPVGPSCGGRCGNGGHLWALTAWHPDITLGEMREDTANYIACHGITLCPQWVDTSNNDKNNLLHCPQLLGLSGPRRYTVYSSRFETKRQNQVQHPHGGGCIRGNVVCWSCVHFCLLLNITNSKLEQTFGSMWVEMCNLQCHIQVFLLGLSPEFPKCHVSNWRTMLLGPRWCNYNIYQKWLTRSWR